MFDLNEALLEKPRELLGTRDDIFWLLGGACTGKSTVSRALAASLTRRY